MATTTTISALNLAPTIQSTANIAIDQNAGTYRTTMSNLATFLSGQNFSGLTAGTGTFGNLAVTNAINTGTLTTTSDVLIGGNLVVLNAETVDGNLLANLYGNVSGLGSQFAGNIYAVVTLPNQQYITNLGNITLNNLTANGNVSVGANLSVTGTASILGTTTLYNPIIPISNIAAVNIGSTTNWFNNVYGTAIHALYADLAERYTSDSDYAPGTVVIFGTDTEVTASYQPNDTRVAGVISTNPAYTMNAAIGGVNVALQGRVPCQVTGPVTRGDLMVTSPIPGVAMTNNNPAMGTVIGKALGNFSGSGVGIIEVVVGRL